MVEVLFPLEVDRENPWVCFRLGNSDPGPVGYLRMDPEVSQQAQAGAEEHQRDPWTYYLADTSDLGHVGCSPKDLGAYPEG